YSAATGEIFPLTIGATRLVDGQGSGATLIVGSADDAVFTAVSPGQPVGLLEIDGLRLVGGRTGLSVNSPARVYQGTLQDVVIDEMAQDGIEAHATPAGQAGSQLNLGFFGGRITHCLHGLTFQTTSPTLKSVLVVGQSTVAENAIGVSIESEGNILASV